MSACPHDSDPRHNDRAFHIRFPASIADLGQDEEYFEFEHDGRTQQLRIHDYAAMYRVPGLYDELVYGKLRCNSPQRVQEFFASVLTDYPKDLNELRVLDLGAGNGIVAEEFKKLGLQSILGLDILPQAAHAARRDRPNVYSDYMVADLCDLDPTDNRCLDQANLNCLVSIAALGFGDIPPEAFAMAFNFISIDGWLVMTIKEDFLESDDDSGFARLVRAMIYSEVVDVQAHQRYRHRLSTDGEPLFYVAVIARKKRDIPASMIDGHDARSKSAIEIETSNQASTLLGM